jgi:hypothetical protein
VQVSRLAAKGPCDRIEVGFVHTYVVSVAHHHQTALDSVATMGITVGHETGTANGRARYGRRTEHSPLLASRSCI